MVGRAYVLGEDGSGWGIWLRERPSVPVLRFGPEEGDRAQQLFEKLEFLEELEPKTLPAVPDLEISHRPLPPPPQPWRYGTPVPPDDRAPRALPRVIWVGMAMFVIAVLAALATHMTVGSGSEPRVLGSKPVPGPVDHPSRTSPTPSLLSEPKLPTLPGVQVYANLEGGYLFSYPDSWVVQSRGTVARLTSPDGSVRVVFDLVPGGSLSLSSDVLVERVMRSHRGVEVVTSSRRSTEQGLRTLLVGGTLRENGTDGRFLAISVQGSDENRAITVYFPEGSGVLDTLEDIRAVISSYRIATPS